MRKYVPVLFALTLTVGCGGGSSNQESTGSPPPPAQAAAPAPASDIGIGPVTHVDLASLDMSASPKGEEIFNTKCSACHKLEERYIGPALEGITTRRKPEWILNMILNPDVMVKEDPTAQGLLAQYIAPMTNFNLTEDEARSVLAFFLEHDRASAAHEVEGGDE